MSEIEAFYLFLGERMQVGAFDVTPEESVQAFRAYQAELARLRADLQPAIKRARGRVPVSTFDPDDVKRRGRERLANEGIVD